MSGSKMALSGLRTVKRDWSTSSKTDSDASLDARAKRMRDIQDGLDGREQTSLSSTFLQNYANATTTDTASGSKRPLPASAQVPAAKKRVLPPGWGKDVYTGSSNFARTTPTEPEVKSKSTGVSPAMIATPSAQPAGHVFLSQEQKQILQLVGSETSLFYTGSAGMHEMT